MQTRIRVRIDARELFADGISFGSVGPYEKISGRITFEVDPEAPAYHGVVDLEHAPRKPSGMVNYSTDVYILRPLELERGNRRLLYDVNNRGNKRILQWFNDGVSSNEPSNPEHAGNGFLMRRGYTIVWSGWQGDILPGNGRLTMTVPIATDNGGEITGVLRTELITDEPGLRCFPLSGNAYTLSYPAASLDTRKATLTYREYERDPRIPIGPDLWEFAELTNKEDNPVPSARHCYLPWGFKPGWIHELIYVAKDSLVLGLGFTGIRDLVSFLRYGERDDDGTPNPLRENDTRMEKAYAWGRSQSGRFLREFVYRGFNEAPHNRRVFDAIYPHVAGGGRIVLNYRLAQPGRFPQQHADHLYPSDQFPFAYPVITDPLTGETDGILKRPDTDPFVIHTQTSSEYWERRGSLVHTDPLGNDLADHEKARVYLLSCAQHSADPLGGAQENPHRHPPNPLNVAPSLRALLDAMDAWATEGTPPPESRVPRRSDETAVPAEEVKARFPTIPGVECPAQPSLLYVQDHGPDFDGGLISQEPPKEDEERPYTVLVPQIDGDGNEVPGVRTPAVEVPLATFTGWNFRPTGRAEKALAALTGSFFRLSPTLNERRSRSDPRPSIEERYRSKPHYVRTVALAAQRLVQQRLLLQEDADRYVELAMKEDLFG